MSPRRRLPIAASVLVLLALAALPAPAAPPGPALPGDEGRLLRFPALSNESIAFVYAGDIWIVPRAGGIARQLTTDPGLEWFPRFSPDGRWIAFTGEYDGNKDVYVMPAEGGEPRRLTWWSDTGQQNERAGPNNIVMGWTKDGKRVLFRSRHQAWESRAGRFYTVSVDGGYPVPLAVPEGGFAAFSPDGDRIVYNRIFRDFRTWKRYRGGMTQNLWIYDLKANKLDKLTENDATSVDPMWIGGTIYTTSDRDRTANIFAIDPATKQAKKLTSFTEYDVKWASAGPDAIVFENGGWIYLLDPATGKNAKVPIVLPSDRRLTRPEYLTVSDRVGSYALAPEGKRAVLTARGEVFTVPAEKGETRNLSENSGANERDASWSPDGKWIAWLSDATGEYEIYVAPQDGKGPARQLTTDGHAWRFPPIWSPDNAKIAFGDKDLKLFVLDVATKKLTQADRGTDSEIRDYAWSPDSRWLAYSKQSLGGFRQVYLYSLESGQVTRVTSEMNDSRAPSFDPKGKYLYFLSDRDYSPTFGNFDFSFTYDDSTRPYALTLRKDLPSPFAPESDEVKAGDESGGGEGDKKKDEAKEGGKKAEKPVEPLKIDLDGIEDRIAGFPVKPGNLNGLGATGGVVLWLSRPDGPGRGRGGASLELKIFDMEKRKEQTLLDGVDGYDISPDGTKVIYKAGPRLGIVEAKPATAKVGDGELRLDGLQMKVDRRAEWREIFDDVWRRERDFYYAANMGGADWNKMKDRYGALVPYVAHRADLTYVLGELIGELSTGHTYVGGGDLPKATSTPIGLLGVDYELDASTGRYRIAKILQGENWVEGARSPLTEPATQVAEGSWLLKIDGDDLKAPVTPDQLLENKAGRVVTILVNDKPSQEGAREVRVKTLSDEEDLRYHDRIESNRRKVDAATGGKVGYVHIPNMGPDGLNEFVRQYYPQIRKEGMIIDVRNNGGGFVSEVILERLRRVLVGMGVQRNGSLSTYPTVVFNGPMVCLINHYAASDGDIFPWYFRRYKLGPLIGTRTWGGVVGIRGISSLIDGGYITAPEFAEYDLEGRWQIEGHGVDPDIEVDNRDDLVVQGHDPQLEKGIEVLMEQIRKSPPKLPPKPSDPIKP